MAKKKSTPDRHESAALPDSDAAAAPSSQFVVFRETIESIVVAFVLAFFIRTFEAEAFVIPTGSMSPSLHGRHKDVNCTQCGFRFRTTASTEDPEEAARRGMLHNLRDAEVVGGMCPMCRYPMPFSRDLPTETLDEVAQFAEVDEIEAHGSYPGDRILVNKYGFDFTEPERWDVVVFKFPGDGNMNYIKRLVGLPGEEIQILHGDVFTRPLGTDEDFRILAKPADKVAATLQPVHDTNYEPASLHKAGWPLRWAGDAPWKVDVAEPQDDELTVRLRYSVDQATDGPLAWLRYRHVPAEHTEAWQVARSILETGSLDELARREDMTPEEAREVWQAQTHTRLITDFNAYNARILRAYLRAGGSWTLDAQPVAAEARDGFLGLNWVGDLAVECDVEVEAARGELTLDLVEAGYHFQATIELKTGECRLGVVDGRTGRRLDFNATGKTAIDGPGSYRLRFANVDDQLLLWVNDELAELSDSTYDPDALLGGRGNMIPWAGEELGDDQGDLAPAGVGARSAKATITRLAVLRDIYYIATKYSPSLGFDAMHMDYASWRNPVSIDGQTLPALSSPQELFAQPEHWPRFKTRRAVKFEVQKEQLFVMGDNSPESADCRLWTSNSADRGIPGGPYLDRRLLIGKAVCVFWPHSWGGVPGLSKLPGWPNFEDMRLVR